MRLAVESVSYSYSGPEGERKARRARARSGARAEAVGASAEARRADWGNDPQDIWALRDVSFSIREGEFFGIAGHTGSGKSTLLQIMNGLIRPTEGRVTFDGLDLSSKHDAARAREEIGLVFQYPEHQLFANTVYDDVAFGPRSRKMDAAEVDRRVREGLRLVGLPFDEVAERSPFSLSGGQQRRVAIAGVLAMEPAVLILDEPMAGIDPGARDEFLGLLESLHDSGRTIVMVSHSMEDLARLCERILILSEGRIFALGAPDEVFADPAALKAVGLGVPAAQALAVKLRQAGFKLDRPLYDMSSLAEDIAAQVGREAAGVIPQTMLGAEAGERHE